MTTRILSIVAAMWGGQNVSLNHQGEKGVGPGAKTRFSQQMCGNDTLAR